MIIDTDFMSCTALCLGIVLAGIGVICFIRLGIIWSSMEKLLQEGDYAREKKKKSPWIGAIATCYWLIVTALYLGYSFAVNDWKGSWIIWPVAGTLFGAVSVLTNTFLKEK